MFPYAQKESKFLRRIIAEKPKTDEENDDPRGFIQQYNKASRYISVAQSYQELRGCQHEFIMSDGQLKHGKSPLAVRTTLETYQGLEL